jgi:hypothetical protein
MVSTKIKPNHKKEHSQIKHAKEQFNQEVDNIY